MISNPHEPSTLQNFVTRAAYLVFFYTFALFNWIFYLGRGIQSGSFFKKPTEQQQLRFAISRDRFWNLSKQPIPGFEHAFFKLRNGLKLHYITNKLRLREGGGDNNDSGNLFILLHGYPDSSMMWRFLLKEPAIPIDSARIVCLDLPNFGGSDTFDKPDATVLEAIAEFTLVIREEHGNACSEANKDFNTIIIGHDWGCVLAFRLAAEAPQLADRFVLMNGPHVRLALANKDRILAASSKIFQQFREAPRQNFGCLQKSLNVLRPLIMQIVSFGYIFVFHLLKIMVQYLGSGGNFFFLRAIARAEHGRHKDECDPQEYLAATLGPGVIEIESKTASGESYGQSVHPRAESPSETFWHQTAYYRNGAAFKRWEKSLETIAALYEIESESSASASVSPIRRRSSSSASSALFTDTYDGALKAPTTILWGENDLAVTRPICLEGISDYLAAGSEVMLLPQSGHWVGVEKESRAALAKIIGTCAAVPAGQELPTYMTKEVEQVYSGVSSVIRR
ncbi:hypothetical protein LTS08_006294 [Lithohypha guttulata]|nr:hypothetical protein LTS08_006294 [Lithohypha guttulata]